MMVGLVRPSHYMNLFIRVALSWFAWMAISPAWAQQGTVPIHNFFFTNRVDTRALPLAQAIKTVQGNGRRTLYVVTDPDCKYCRQLEGALSQLKNVTIYRFEYPLTQLHPNAANIAKQIWCAPDRAQAWDAYEAHRTKPANDGRCANPIDDNIRLAARLDIEGTPSLISSDGRRHAGTLSLDRLEQFVDGTP